MKLSSKVVQEFVSRPGFEALGNYPLYDKISLAAAIIPPVSTFFQHTIGANTIAITNMLVAGQMPHPERFLITSINCAIMPPVAAGVAVGPTLSDGQIIRTATTIKITVNGGNEILTVPTALVPSGNDVVAAASLFVNGWQDVKNAFPFVYPLESKVTFAVTLERAAANGTIVSATDVMIVLNGIRFRSVQR